MPPESTIPAANLLVSTTQVINLPPVLTISVENFSTDTAGVLHIGGKLATSVNNPGGKFAANVNNNGGKLPLISRTQAANFMRKKTEVENLVALSL